MSWGRAGAGARAGERPGAARRFQPTCVRRRDGAATTRWVALPVALGLVACAPRRDVVPETHDVQGAAVDPSAARRTAEGYEHVARRALGIVGLAEARGIAAPVAAQAVDRVADAL